MAYVSRKQIIEHIEKFYDTVPLYTDERHLVAGLKAYIKNLPTADVVEVKHGVWEDLYNSRYDNPLYVCSKCNCRALRTNEKDELGHIKCRQELSPYCPHCGAKMDGERRDA